MLHLESTAKSGRLSSDGKKPPLLSGSAGGEGGVDGPLVIRPISQRNAPDEFLVYPQAVKIVRARYGQNTDSTPPERTEIQGFSDKSRRRLRFLAGNTSSPLISQFCLTYHRTTPDGRTVKKHLNSWLTRLRRRFPGVHYLWVLEFQTRGVPHFHVWLSLPHYMRGLQRDLAESWHRIAEPDSPEHLAFHLYPGQSGWEDNPKLKRPNLMPWDMRSPGYLCKYLDKQSQKAIPLGFVGCGRFWGNSRGLLAIPEGFTSEDLDHLMAETIDEETGEVLQRSTSAVILRILGKLHERKLKRSPWRSRARTALTSYTLQTAAPAFRHLLGWLRRDFERRENLPF